MKSIRLLTVLALTALFDVTARAHDKSAPLNDAQKAYLSSYESVRVALAADNLAAAKKAADVIAKAAPAEDQGKAAKAGEKAEDNKPRAYFEAAQKLATAADLDTAREQFKVLSKRAVHYGEGKEGYYVANCPMVKGGGGDWVQTSKQISNPYFGKAMLTCGSIK